MGEKKKIFANATLLLPTLCLFSFCAKSGEPSADAGRGQRELSHGGPEQRAGDLRPVSPWSPGNCLSAAGVWCQCGRGV